MKAVILAGGLGTRLTELTRTIPKPMVRIGDKPIIWHIMKTFYHHGVREFIICLGYKGEKIKEYFVNDYLLSASALQIDMKSGLTNVLKPGSPDWEVTLVDTGAKSMTGGRLKRVEEYLSGEKEFFFTYGDGLTDLNIKDLYKTHISSGKLATVTAVQNEGRFGSLGIDEQNNVSSFVEKTKGDGNWINGGYFVLNTKVFSLIRGDETVWEDEPLKSLSKDNQLAAHKHSGFWYAMDSLRDKEKLEDLWNTGNAPWN